MCKVQINCQLTLIICVYCFSFVCYMKHGLSQTNEIQAVYISCNVTISDGVVFLSVDNNTICLMWQLTDLK